MFCHCHLNHPTVLLLQACALVALGFRPVIESRVILPHSYGSTAAFQVLMNPSLWVFGLERIERVLESVALVLYVRPGCGSARVCVFRIRFGKQPLYPSQQIPSLPPNRICIHIPFSPRLPPLNPVCARRSDPSVLAFSLS